MPIVNHDPNPDPTLWPVPDPTLGDGSDRGESDINDGTPGAHGDEDQLRAVYVANRPNVVVRKARQALGLVQAMIAADDSVTSTLPVRVGVAVRRLVGLSSAWPVIASPNYSSRRGATPRLLIFHTAEGARDRAGLGAFFARKATGASSHGGVDDTGITRYVPCAYSAWTARSANPIAVQLELCAFSAWTRAEWFRHPGMLEYAAQWAAAESVEHNIPLIRRRNAETKTQAGVCTHHDITVGWRDGTHVDCGNSFPLDEVIERARQIVAEDEDDMTPEDRRKLDAIYNELTQRLPNRTGDPDAKGSDTVAGNAANADGYGYRTEREMIKLRGEMAALRAEVAGVPAKSASALLDTSVEVDTIDTKTGVVTPNVKVNVRTALTRASEGSIARWLLSRIGDTTAKK